MELLNINKINYIEGRNHLIYSMESINYDYTCCYIYLNTHKLSSAFGATSAGEFEGDYRFVNK